MKKIVWMVMFITLLTVPVISIHAAALPSDIELSEDVYEEKEYQEVREICEAFAKEINAPPNRQIRTGYKLYAMDAGVFSNLITSDIPLKQLVMKEWAGAEQPYEWILTSGGVNYYELRQVKNTWEVSSYSENRYGRSAVDQPAGSVWASGLVDYYDVAYEMQQVSQKGEKLTGEQLVFTLGAVNVTFFAFRSKQETYLVAFPWRPYMTGLESGACYTAQEVKEILDKRYPVIYQGDEIEEELLSSRPVSSFERIAFENVTSWPPEEERPKTWLWLCGAIALMAVYAAVLFVVRKKQRQGEKSSEKHEISVFSRG